MPVQDFIARPVLGALGSLALGDMLAPAIHILHVGFAAAMIGAVLFQWWALHPSLSSLPDEQRTALRTGVTARWRMVVFAAIVLLILTGLINFIAYKIPAYRDHPYKGIYHGLFGLKVLAALGVFHISACLAVPGRIGEKYRARADVWLGRLSGLMILIVIVGGVLFSFDRILPR
jgi:hypothetical protein